tara:strand:- start:167 stop:559 length:393 start_codon:yes stop_codon:yes gene_type:complete
MNPFDFLNSINYSKKDMFDVPDTSLEELERGYSGYHINRSLSYFPDTVDAANITNRYHHLDNKLQYHFLLNIIRKKRRFSKWIKADPISDIEVVKQYYGYSNTKAKQALSLLSPDQINIIRQKVDQGGRK